MATRRRAKAAPEPEVVEEDAFEELDEDTDDLEELEDDAEEVEETPALKPRGRKAAPKTITEKGTAVKAASAGSEYNSAWLAEHVSEVTGESHDARSLRMLLRKMAENGELDRTVGEDRSRYTFPKGANDPTVKLLVRKIKSGELKAVKKAGLENVKAKAAAKKATAPAEDEAPATPRRTRATKATKAAPAKAAPAKATTRTRRTRAAAE